MSRSNALVASIISALFVTGCNQAPQPISQAEGLHVAVRVKQDTANARRWELGWGAALAYDATSGKLLRRVPLMGATLSGARGTCRPDLVVSKSGAVIVSSNAEPVLWRIDPATFEIRRYDIALDSDRSKDFGFSALAWGVEERVLYAASAITGTLWRIDLGASSASKVELSSPIRGACTLTGSEGAAGTQTLEVESGAGAATRHISLSPDLARADVTGPLELARSILR